MSINPVEIAGANVQSQAPLNKSSGPFHTLDDSPSNGSIRVSIKHRSKEETEAHKRAKRFISPQLERHEQSQKAQLLKHSGSSPSYRMQLPQIKSQAVVIAPPDPSGKQNQKHAMTNQRIGLNAKDPNAPAPIIEEVTKENFFTKGQARSSSFLPNSNPSHNGSFQNERRSASQVQQAQNLHMTYKEKQEKSHAQIPHDCKVLCFCQSRTMLANLVRPQKLEKGEGNLDNTFMSSRKMSKTQSSLKQVINPDSELMVCAHSGTSDIQLVSNILLDQAMNLRLTDAHWDSELNVVGGGINKVAFVRNAQFIHQLSDIVKSQTKEINNLQAEVTKHADLWQENSVLKEGIQNLRIQNNQIEMQLQSIDQTKYIKQIEQQVKSKDALLKQTLDYLKNEHTKVESLMKVVRSRERSLNTALKIAEIVMQGIQKFSSAVQDEANKLNKETSQIQSLINSPYGAMSPNPYAREQDQEVSQAPSNRPAASIWEYLPYEDFKEYSSTLNLIKLEKKETNVEDVMGNTMMTTKGPAFGFSSKLSN